MTPLSLSHWARCGSSLAAALALVLLLRPSDIDHDEARAVALHSRSELLGTEDETDDVAVVPLCEVLLKKDVLLLNFGIFTYYVAGGALLTLIARKMTLSDSDGVSSVAFPGAEASRSAACSDCSLRPGP